MAAWSKDQRVEGSIITFMADTHGKVSEALGVLMEHPGPRAKLGYPRCQRHALYVEDGVIKAFEVAASPDDPAGDAKPDVTLVESMLSKVPDLAPAEQYAALAKIEAETREDIAEASDAIKAFDLVLFIKPRCPFCKGALESLQDNGFFPKVVDTTRSQQRGLQALTGKTSLPSCWVQGNYVGGCNDGIEAWHGVKPMIASGKLRQMLGGYVEDVIAGA
eukprot:gnl/TRDRNA2_/TRDRNA2_175971_c0_seq3.p1 gnl/TRDRNA2_/TRDRNA2_175971_c0~~gnl/TRDRNA2_/TRDRNA2_175971_c0_seq3.p1  ORF type:complete len:219 (-),score=46.51 gnl/TRDRNA2_/TRDRNA2_175971_c0_seq3:134-790(-)